MTNNDMRILMERVLLIPVKESDAALILAYAEVELNKKASQPAQDDHINSAVKHIGDVDDMPPLVDFLMHPEDN